MTDTIPSVATIIRDQIGRRALFMLGAKNLIDHGQALSFRIRGSRAVNYVKVTLNGLDLYDVEFGRIRGYDYRVVEELDGIYADQLHTTIEAATGLRTSL